MRRECDVPTSFSVELCRQDRVGACRAQDSGVLSSDLTISGNCQGTAVLHV